MVAIWAKLEAPAAKEEQSGQAVPAAVAMDNRKGENQQAGAALEQAWQGPPAAEEATEQLHPAVVVVEGRWQPLLLANTLPSGHPLACWRSWTFATTGEFGVVRR